MRPGFTLLEVLFALTIMTLAVVGVFGLMQQTIAFLPVSTNRLIASYLAQEGIEVVRNLRDANKIKEVAWNQGLTACSAPGGCEADYTSQALTPWTGNGRFLNLDSGFYRYSSSGTPTIFRRRLTITVEAADRLSVLATVSWRGKDQDHQVSASEKLFDWQ